MGDEVLDGGEGAVAEDGEGGARGVAARGHSTAIAGTRRWQVMVISWFPARCRVATKAQRTVATHHLYRMRKWSLVVTFAVGGVSGSTGARPVLSNAGP